VPRSRQIKIQTPDPNVSWFHRKLHLRHAGVRWSWSFMASAGSRVAAKLFAIRLLIFRDHLPHGGY